MEPARLLIIDDHDAVREALEARLKATPGIEVIGCTGCWKRGRTIALDVQPDVVLLETKRADGEGLQALASLREACPRADVLVLTSYMEPEEWEDARSQGAARYLMKDIDTTELVRAIRSGATT